MIRSLKLVFALCALALCAAPAHALNASGAPVKLPLPFANNAGGSYIRTIPKASQILITPGAASLYDGFPPLNFAAIAAGGIPPSGKDFNGILNWSTGAIQYAQAGMIYPYDATFATAVSGYPSGAVVASTTAGGYWRNTADGNATNPDMGGSNWVDLFAQVYASPVLAHVTKTRTVLTSGSGTYFTPAGVRSISIRMVGGGGGAQNSYNGSFPITVASTAGGDTTFGSLTAGGGSSGDGVAGGTSGGGDVNVQPGGAGAVPNAGHFSDWASGAQGGNSPLGQGGGGIGTAATGYGGGGGGGYVQTTAAQAGSSGQGGGYVEKLISSPAASYAYSIGAPGVLATGGVLGGSTATGGIIIVDENY